MGAKTLLVDEPGRSIANGARTETEVEAELDKDRNVNEAFGVLLGTTEVARWFTVGEVAGPTFC